MPARYRTDIPPAYLSSRLDYNPDTGLLYWKAAKDMSAAWNARFRGAEAFTTTTASGYKSGAVDGIGLLAHRVAWCIAMGQWPQDQIDHIDHDRSNNKLSNLRDVSRSENMKNVSLYSSNKSSVAGVMWIARLGAWHSRIKVDGLVHDLGVHRNFDDAVSARKSAEAKYGFHENHGMAAE